MGYHAIGVALRDLVLHHGWQQSSAVAFVCKIMARPSSPVAAVANLVVKAYLKLTDLETAQFVVSCQEGLDKDSVSALLDDIDKLAPAEPLYLGPGMVRLDPAVILTCQLQEHWTDLWLCLAAVCCSRKADLDAFKKQRAGWDIKGDSNHYLTRQPGTELFPALSEYEQEWQRMLSSAAILGVEGCMPSRLEQVHNVIACLCDSKITATAVSSIGAAITLAKFDMCINSPPCQPFSGCNPDAKGWADPCSMPMRQGAATNDKLRLVNPSLQPLINSDACLILNMGVPLTLHCPNRARYLIGAVLGRGMFWSTRAVNGSFRWMQ